MSNNQNTTLKDGTHSYLYASLGWNLSYSSEKSISKNFPKLNQKLCFKLVYEKQFIENKIVFCKKREKVAMKIKERVPSKNQFIKTKEDKRQKYYYCIYWSTNVEKNENSWKIIKSLLKCKTPDRVLLKYSIWKQLQRM